MDPRVSKIRLYFSISSRRVSNSRFNLVISSETIANSSSFSFWSFLYFVRSWKTQRKIEVMASIGTDHFQGLFETSSNVSFITIAIVSTTSTTRRARKEGIVLQRVTNDFGQFFHRLSERMRHLEGSIRRSLVLPLLSSCAHLRPFSAAQGFAVRSRAVLNESNSSHFQLSIAGRRNERSRACWNLFDAVSRSLMACSRSY